MEKDFDAADLADSLYAFRSKVAFYLTGGDPLPEYLATPLWQSLELVQPAIQELEQRHDCRERGLMDLGPGNGLQR